MSAPLVGVVPTFTINFWAYDQGVLLLHDMLGLHEDQRLPVRYSGIAGSLAGIPTVVSTLAWLPASPGLGSWDDSTLLGCFAAGDGAHRAAEGRHASPRHSGAWLCQPH